MKKTICICILCSFLSAGLHAQLTDSKWKSSMNIPDVTETILHFKKDSVFLSVAADGSLVETMSYSISRDTLRLTKLSGMSPCTESTIGLYRFELKDDKLTIVPLSDDCQERANAFTPEAWTRQKI